MRLRGHPAGSFASPPLSLLWWGPAVAMVGTAEEVCLRGLLQPWLRRRIGVEPAILLVALFFAAYHVLRFGLVSFPLDLGVGIVLGVLRQVTASVGACALAHAIADVGCWWVA